MIAAATGPSAHQAQHEAQRILAERRFKEAHVPDPLGGVFTAIGDLLTKIGNWIDHGVQSLAGGLPGGTGLLIVIGAALALGLSAWLTARTLRRRAEAAGPGAGTGRAAARPVDPRALERAADDAEQAGDFDAAVRLRFRAGLVRLDRGGRFRVRESTPTREVARALRSPTFDRVAAGFDAVAYGARVPGAEDARLQRSGWRALLDEVGAA